VREAVAAGDGIADLIAHQDRAERRVPAGDAFGGDDHIRCHAASG
jgi:hypothetical protein